MRSTGLSRSEDKALLPEEKAGVQRQNFNGPLNVHRRLIRVMMSYCTSLKQAAIRDYGPEELMQTIREPTIVYYEAWKLPESGFLHGGKHTNFEEHISS